LVNAADATLVMIVPCILGFLCGLYWAHPAGPGAGAAGFLQI
jgi:hypothetical protein